jgi:hypothetical protein
MQSGIPNQPQSREVALRAAVGCILSLALALLAQKVLIAILDPNFG